MVTTDAYDSPNVTVPPAALLADLLYSPCCEATYAVIEGGQRTACVDALMTEMAAYP
jgi:hypothetical protein